MGFDPPSLRTGRADLPHPALQSMVLPTRGLARLLIGTLQAEEPMFGKEGIGPRDVVGAAGDPRAPVLLARDIAQPPADPAVERRECRALAVLEVVEPAAQRRIEVLDDLEQAVSRGAFGLGPDHILELLQAFGGRWLHPGGGPISLK